MQFLNSLLVDILGRRKDNFDWRCGQPPLDLSGLGNVCVLQPNHKVGDMILISTLVDALAHARPDLTIDVATSSSFASYWSCHPSVSSVIVLDPGKHLPLGERIVRGWREAKRWRRRIDVAVSFQSFARAEHFAILRYLQPRMVIGFNKEAYRLFDYSLEEHRQGVDLAPIAQRTRAVMRLFGHEIEVSDLKPHVPCGSLDPALGLDGVLLPSLRGPRVLVNVYGAGREKRIVPGSARRVLDQLRGLGHRGDVFVSVPEGESDSYRRALGPEGELGRTVVLGPQQGLPALCAFVAAMDVVISPDTAVGHIAAALGKAQICLFGRRGSTTTIWKPLNDRCEVLFPPTGSSVNDVDWAEMERALRRTLQRANSPSATAGVSSSSELFATLP